MDLCFKKNKINMYTKKINYLKKNGFCIIEKVISASYAKSLANLLTINAKKSQYYELKTGSEIVYNPFNFSNKFLNLIINKKIIDFVNQVFTNSNKIILNAQLASNSILFDEKKLKISKKKFALDTIHGVHTDFHQQFCISHEPLELGLMIALDSFLKDSGSTVFFKGSHLSNNKPNGSKLVSSIKNYRSANVELKPGDVCFFYGSTQHAAGINTSGKRRWGLSQRYTPWYIKPMFDFTSLSNDQKFLDKIKKNNKLFNLFGFNSIPPSIIEKRIFTVTKHKSNKYFS